MKTKQIARRETVTVEDRRAVLMTAKGRKPQDMAKMDNETFIRRALKERMGVPHAQPAPESVKKAASELAGVLSRQALVALATKVAAEQKARAKAAAMAAECLAPMMVANPEMNLDVLKEVA